MSFARIVLLVYVQARARCGTIVVDPDCAVLQCYSVSKVTR